MILPVRLYTDPILHKVCKPVENFDDPSLEILVQNMIETMKAYNGVGLAAPQVGQDLQLAILHTENRTKITAIVNPAIIKRAKEKDKQLEGCLSSPGVSFAMKRFKDVVVEGKNLLGEKVEYYFTEYDARIVQHEIDHLQGKLICSSGLKNTINLL